MTTSKQTSTQIASGPGMGQLSGQGPSRIENQYQSDIANPNRLVPQASSYLGNVLGGQYLNPQTNPHWNDLVSAIGDPIRAGVSAQFSRAGRGTSASASGLAGTMTEALAKGIAPAAFSHYGQERGFQQQAAGLAGPLDAAGSLPLEQYLERMRSLATLGQKGTQTTTGSPLQTIAGLGLTAAGMFGSGGFNLFGGK